MRGFSIRLRHLGMCDILVEHNLIVKYLLYPAVFLIPPPGTSSIWLDIYVALAILTLPRDIPERSL